MILGLDVSTSITGFAVVAEGEIVFYDSVDLRKYKNLFEKAERILGWRPHTDMESLVKKVTLEIE